MTDSRLALQTWFTGYLFIKGTLLSNNKKWTGQYVIVRDGCLSLFATEDDMLDGTCPIDIVLLTNCVIAEPEVVGKEHPFSFVLLKKDEKKWKTEFSPDSLEDSEWCKKVIQKNISLTKATLFGNTIQDGCMKSNKMIPIVVEQCLMFIDTQLEAEGLFRVPGQQTVVDDIKDRYNQGLDVVFDSSTDVHNVCGLFKLYLRELADPLIPSSHYRQFIAIGGISNPEEALDALKIELSLLPDENLSVLSYVISSLARVAKHKDKNLMGHENIATVFGPTIMRPPETEGISAESLQEMQNANILISLLVQYESIIFDEHIKSLWNIPVYDISEDNERYRAVITLGEEEVIEPALDQFSLNSCGIRRFHTQNKKTNVLEERIVIVAEYRLYICLPGGKLLHSFHISDYSIQSDSNNSLDIKVEGSKDSPFHFLPLCYATHDIDYLISHCLKMFGIYYVGQPTDTKFNIQPPSRLNSIAKQLNFSDFNNACSGYGKTYEAVCDKIGKHVLDDIVWDIDNVHWPEENREFNLEEFTDSSKYPNNINFEPLVKSLAHNLWFDTFKVENIDLGNENLSLIGEMLRTNNSLTNIILKDVGGHKNVITEIFNKLLENKSLRIQKIDLSRNSIEDKGMTAFIEPLSNQLGRTLTHLTIANCQLGKKGLHTFFELASTSESLCNNLILLDISHNKMDIECSRLLGSFMGKALSLESINLASSSPSFTYIALTCMGNDSIMKLDISNNKVKDFDEMSMIIRILAKLENLNISSLNLPFDTILKICNENSLKIKVLNVSDNEITDENFTFFCSALIEMPNLALREMNISGCLSKKSKGNADAIYGLSNLVNTIPIEKLLFKGGGKSTLRQDIIPFIFSLSANDSLTYLDISHQEAGDELCNALRRVLQINKSIKSLLMDNNGTTVLGFKKLKIALARNNSVIELPLPISDVTNVIKHPEGDVNGTINLIEDIEKEIYLNAFKMKNERYSRKTKKSKNTDSSKSLLSRSTTKKKKKSGSRRKRQDDEDEDNTGELVRMKTVPVHHTAPEGLAEYLADHIPNEEHKSHHTSGKNRKDRSTKPSRRSKPSDPPSSDKSQDSIDLSSDDDS